MPLKFRCPCGQSLIVSRKLCGQAVRCPRCETKLRVPQLKSTEGSSSDSTSSEKSAQERPPAAPPVGAKQSPESSLAAVSLPPVRSDQERPPVPPPRPLPPAIPSPSLQTGWAATNRAAADEVCIENAAEITDQEAAAAEVRGYEPHPRYVSSARWLAVGLACSGLFATIPAVMDIVEHLRAPNSPYIARWAFLLLWIGVIQVAYAIYLWQLPDWSSTWVVTLLLLVLSVVYAMGLGATYLSSADGWFVQLLQVNDKLAGRQATGWCFIMLCLTSLICYLSGRMSARWQLSV